MYTYCKRRMLQESPKCSFWFEQSHVIGILLFLLLLKNFFDQGKNPGGSNITNINYKISLAGHHQQNCRAAKQNQIVAPQRKSVGIKTKMLEHPSRLQQSTPAQLAQELKSIPDDWAVELHRNRDEFTLR